MSTQQSSEGNAIQLLTEFLSKLTELDESSVANWPDRNEVSRTQLIGDFWTKSRTLVIQPAWGSDVQYWQCTGVWNDGNKRVVQFLDRRYLILWESGEAKRTFLRTLTAVQCEILEKLLDLQNSRMPEPGIDGPEVFLEYFCTDHGVPWNPVAACDQGLQLYLSQIGTSEIPMTIYTDHRYDDNQANFWASKDGVAGLFARQLPGLPYRLYWKPEQKRGFALVRQLTGVESQAFQRGFIDVVDSRP